MPANHHAPGLAKLLRVRDRETGESFDGEKYFWECEQRIVETEAGYRKAYRKAMAGYEVDWPE